MPETPTTYNYYPALSGLMTADDLPEILGFIRDGLQQIFEKVYYKNYYSSVNQDGSFAFYSLEIVSRTKLAVEFPGTGIFFVLNPDYEDTTITSFPITLQWNQKILRFLGRFSMDQFSFSQEDFFNLAIEIFEVSEADSLQLAENTFVEVSTPGVSRFQQLVNDINTLYSSSIVIDENSDARYEELAAAIHNINEQVYTTVFVLYLVAPTIEETKERISYFFSSFVSGDVEQYILSTIKVNARATLELSAAIEFPPNILKPVTENGEEIPDQVTRFEFARALLYADTQSGIGYAMDLAGSLYPPFASVANTGLLLNIDTLKVDLSTTTNISEADEDGRPSDFVGVYARAVSVTFPPKWFHDDDEPTTGNVTLRLGGYDILLGTGGISGTITLESVPMVSTTFNYYNDRFTFVYPVTLFELNEDTEELEERSFSNYTELNTYLQTLNNTSNTPFPFKYPLSLTPIGSTEVLTFENAYSYQKYLATLNEGILWKRLGSENGFRIGFKSFDITFKQNEIVSSSILGALEIPSFTYPEGTIVDGHDVGGQIVRINVEGAFANGGDFLLTASANPPFPLEFKNILKLHVKSVELGREGDDFFIGASCDLEFLGMLGEFLEGQSISISSLRIYSNGRIEFHVEGGNLTLPKPIKLNLGPVQLSVTALHFGSNERELDGQMRKYNYFGFDGGVNIGIAGLDARGDGIKFYYTVDDGPGKSPDSYLHIQTIHVDLVIPANSSDPNVMLKGWLSIPEPGVSPEYRGGIDLKLKNPRISGKVDMRLAPKYPAFLIDAGIELPNPIALGAISIYGFRGLLGYRYVAEKEAVPGLTSENTWYEYYKAPQRGVNVNKFSGPDKTEGYSNPVSLGVGAILGDTMALGNIFSANAMLLLSLPSMIMVDARMKLLSKRVTFSDDPPFFAFFIIGDNSMEFGFGADYKFPENSGDIIKIYAEIQAGFFFNNPSGWYINIGTQQNPITASILKDLFSFKSYVMLSGAGIRAGARGEIRFEQSIGPLALKFLAYMELGGYISFERPQMGGYFEVGIEVSLKMVIVDFSLAITTILAVESPKPFKIYGKFNVKIKIKILFVINVEASGTIEFKWEFNNTVDRTPVNPMTETTGQIDGLVKGVSMLTSETFDLANLRQSNGQINIDLAKIRKKVIPLDTYVDIKTTKGLIPSEQVNDIIGGLNNPPERYTDLIPPQKVMKGIEVRQVKHKYSIEEIKIMAYSPQDGWRPYNPYKAMYPENTEPQLNNMKAGQWQKKDNSYNAIRVLATSPFSYTEQGLPGWFIPEQYGITAHTLFCQGVELAPHLSHFLDKVLGTVYWASEDSFFESLEANYQIPGQTEYNIDEQGNVLPEGTYGRITDRPNVFDYKQSLEYPFGQPLLIMLSGPSVEVQIKQTTTAETLSIECYRPLINDDSSVVEYELVLTKVVTGAELSQPIQITFPENKAVTKLIMYTTNIRKEWDMIHEIAWVTLEDYEYNMNIPSQETINDDAEATLSAINDYLPPIWRPDTSYYIQFKLKDDVDNGGNEAFYEFAYGFHTAGPVGFFHTDEYSPYGPLTGNDTDQYPHTSLRAYIDYDRSYPNADGDLISAKPLFYNDTTTEVNLFFTSRYADRMLTGWGAYDNFPALGGTMKIIIKDPVEEIGVINPPNLETTYESIELSPLPIPQTIETWALDENPLLPNTVNQWFNMLPEGCTAVYEDPQPLTHYRKIETKRLKPQKLYTVQVVNFYWGTVNIDPENITQSDKDKYSRPIHQYVFQTSRYRNFEEQVQSYYTFEEDETTVSDEHLYTIETELSTDKLDAALSTIKGVPDEMSRSIETQFQHPFDRVVEGLFGIEPLNKAMTTEINRIVTVDNDRVVALLIRNPEPFNHPRFPLEVVSRLFDEEDELIQEGMIEVLLSDLSGINTAYSVLYSKDYSQAIIMNNSKNIAGSTISLQFIYKIWNGDSYPVVDIQKINDVPIN